MELQLTSLNDTLSFEISKTLGPTQATLHKIIVKIKTTTDYYTPKHGIGLDMILSKQYRIKLY